MTTASSAPIIGHSVPNFGQRLPYYRSRFSNMIFSLELNSNMFPEAFIERNLIVLMYYQNHIDILRFIRDDRIVKHPGQKPSSLSLTITHDIAARVVCRSSSLRWAIYDTPAYLLRIDNSRIILTGVRYL